MCVIDNKKFLGQHDTRLEINSLLSLESPIGQKAILLVILDMETEHNPRLM